VQESESVQGQGDVPVPAQALWQGSTVGAGKDNRSPMMMAFGSDSLCKLCLIQPKIGKSAYCKEDRKKVEATKRSIDKQGDAEAKKVFAELERIPDATQLRICVNKAEELNNPDGTCTRGKPRGVTFDILAYRLGCFCQQSSCQVIA
jgi:hypothetical protein